MRKNTLLTAAACAATVLGLIGTAPATAATTAAPATTSATATTATTSALAAPDTADFNNDGYPDLAIGAHTATVNGLKKAGAVSVVYGSATGFQHDKASVITQSTQGVEGDPSEGNHWSHVSGHGDFDHDGYDDLLIASYSKLQILWGSKQGITGASVSVPTGWEHTGGPDRLQTAAAIGDVNGDGTPDILSTTWGSGRLGHALVTEYGPFDRTTGKPKSVVHRDTASQDGHDTSAVQAGDMTGDGIGDVLIGGYTKQWVRKTTLFRGTRTNGLVKVGDVPNASSGSFGDINGDGHQDFVSRGDEKVTVIYGGPGGVSATLPSRSYSQASAGVPGTSETGDLFGSTVAVADTDQDGYADILIGAPGETGTDPATTARSGAITVLRGSKTGVTTTGAKSFTQNSAGIPSTSELDDKFGTTIRVLDSDKDGKPEVYIGGHGEDNFTGRVWKLKTDTTGVTGTGATSFNLADLGGSKGLASFGFRTAG
ncbi:FG-GAP-like repeat-containing protein [Streptomyces sp. NPDC051211]|uniref:FG-GAP-like repeat-containing protein n=1 Tax=Streptomyces sp. NPDC051211 TaxID=3154643 RepID=UPI00344CE3BC